MAEGAPNNPVKKKNWFLRHKFLTILLVVIVLVVLMVALAGTDTPQDVTTDEPTQASEEKEYRFAERADKQASDIEVLLNEVAEIDGVKMTATSAEYSTSLSEFETAESGKQYLVVAVKLENTSDRTKPYNSFNFRVQTAGGQVLDGTFATVPNPLESGDLVTGGTVSGNVVFEVPVEEGHQYMIWKPDFGSSERAIVRVK